MTSHSLPINQQENSHLMQLPQEIRDQIYGCLFSSTRFCFGERAVGRLDIDTRRVVSKNKGASLALLRVCQRAHVEIGPSWLEQVLFHFEDPKALLDKLAVVDDAVRSHIRYVRVSGNTCDVEWGYDDCYYRTAQILKLLPSLRLSRLTVLGPKYPRTCYESLEDLIKYSDGWKELYYISHSSEMLGFRAVFDIKRHARLAQPMNWQAALDGRDGHEARSSVKVYRSDSPTRGSILDPEKRKPFEQHMSPGQAATEYGKTEDMSLMAPGEREKELLIVVRRGNGIEYAERNPTSYLPTGDIRDDSSALTWAEVKATSKAMSAAYRDDYDTDSGEEDEEEALLDSYEDVSEYTWPPFHFVR